MKASLNSLHHEGADWQRELDFYKDEITILSKRLEEVISKNTGKDIAAQVEHFQNKFIVLREQIDTMKHDINIREQKIEKMSADRPEHIDEHFSMIRDKVFAGVKDFARDFADTRFEFNRFLEGSQFGML